MHGRIGKQGKGRRGGWSAKRARSGARERRGWCLGGLHGAVVVVLARPFLQSRPSHMKRRGHYISVPYNGVEPPIGGEPAHSGRNYTFLPKFCNKCGNGTSTRAWCDLHGLSRGWVGLARLNLTRHTNTNLGNAHKAKAILTQLAEGRGQQVGVVWGVCVEWWMVEWEVCGEAVVKAVGGWL